MGKKGFAKIVVAVGFLIMIIGTNMDVTVGHGSGRVANIHKISERQTLMMLGGFVFLGGLILFGVARMKQTPEEEAQEAAESEKAAEARETYLQQRAETATQFLSNWRQLAKRIFISLVAGLLAFSILAYVMQLALYVGVMPFEFYKFIGSISTFIIFGLVIYFARRDNYPEWARSTFAIESSILGLFFVIAIISSSFWPQRNEEAWGVGFYFVIAMISHFVAPKSVRKR